MLVLAQRREPEKLSSNLSKNKTSGLPHAGLPHEKKSHVLHENESIDRRTDQEDLQVLLLGQATSIDPPDHFKWYKKVRISTS